MSVDLSRSNASIGSGLLTLSSSKFVRKKHVLNEDTSGRCLCRVSKTVNEQTVLFLTNFDQTIQQRISPVDTDESTNKDYQSHSKIISFREILICLCFEDFVVSTVKSTPKHCIS